MLSLPIDDLLRWNEATHKRWLDLLKQHPELFTLGTDIRESQTVAQLLQHIVAVELRYAQRLAAQPESDYNDVPYATPDEIFATHTQAIALVKPLLEDNSYDWTQKIEFQTITAGRLKAPRRDVLVHLLLHGMRHYAQLATLVRQAGVKPGWPMDFLFVNAERA